MENDTVSVAELLREAREEQGLSIQTIAKEICVRSTFLKDIEAGRFDRLPAPAFSVGFVRAYAKLLGLDCDEIVAAFKDEIGVNAAAPKKENLIDASVEPQRRGLPGWLTPVAGLVGVSMCWFMVGGNLASLGLSTGASTADAGYSSVAEEKAQLEAVKAKLPGAIFAEKDREGIAQQAVLKDRADSGGQAPVRMASAASLPVSAPVAEEETTRKPVYEEARSLFLPAAHASSPSVSATSTEGDVRLEAREDAWVRLANADGSELWSGVLREGQSYSPQHDGQLYLSTSNAGGLMVAVGGAPAHALGSRGEIVSDLKLGPTTRLSSVNGSSVEATGSR